MYVVGADSSEHQFRTCSTLASWSSHQRALGVVVEQLGCQPCNDDDTRLIPNWATDHLTMFNREKKIYGFTPLSADHFVGIYIKTWPFNIDSINMENIHALLKLCSVWSFKFGNIVIKICSFTQKSYLISIRIPISVHDQICCTIHFVIYSA